MRESSSYEAEIEEAIASAERTVMELDSRSSEHHRLEARRLENMTRAVRMALVADVGRAVLMRLHLRLETSIRHASVILAELDEVPASQRPTFRPPALESTLDTFDLDFDRPSARPTREAPPPAYSGAPAAPYADAVRPASVVIPKVDARTKRSA